MKTEKSTFRILFYLKRTKTLNNGELTIFMRITVNGERVEVSTHQSIELHLWNQEKGIVKGVSISSKQMNDYLEHLKLKAYRYKKELESMALANDWLKKDPFRSITYRLKEVNRAYLTDPELKLLINKEFSNERLRRVKDIFLFSCFTGLAFSDVKSLTYHNSHQSENSL